MIIKNKWSVVKKGSKGSVVSREIRGLKPLSCQSVPLGKELNHNYLSSLS